MKLGTVCLLFAVAASGACTAKTVSPPLSSQGAATQRTFGDVYLSSGRIKRPHKIIGVFQMTQKGYKWFHEVEIVDDANPASLLYKIGVYAREHGADGVQHLVLKDLNPQTPGEKAKKQFESAVRISDAIANDRPGDIAGEGTETRWEVRGELIRFAEAKRRR